MPIAEHWARLREEIEEACRAAGRDRREITLVVVTKTQPPERIREAHACGARLVGENRVQELLAKKPALEELGLEWHLVGHLQTNKVKAVLPHIALLHSLDRIELARKIEQQAAGVIDALLQVNTTSEDTKSGVAPGGTFDLVDAVRACGRIRLRGLMTIGLLGGAPTENRRAFSSLRELRDGLRRRHPDLELPILSMGMSDDFREAIQEGATHLRIGSRIFGPRPAP
jgi:hypothetical protein